MSYTKEFSKTAKAGFKGAWYYKPWYVRSRETLPDAAQSSGILGPQGLEWPKYPGGYKPTWEQRSGIPGLYKPSGVAPGGLPAMKVAFISGRSAYRGGRVIYMVAVIASLAFAGAWFRLHRRFDAHLKDEDAFRFWACAAYMQANHDCRNFTESAKLDLYCREHLDHLPGVHRTFYHQDNLYQPLLHETSTAASGKRSIYGNFWERPPTWEKTITH